MDRASKHSCEVREESWLAMGCYEMKMASWWENLLLDGAVGFDFV